MVTNKHGIVVDDGTFGKNKSVKVRVQKKQSIKRYDRYVQMIHKLDKHNSVVTPFDQEYIKQLKSEGYKLVDDFRINRLGG